MNPLFADEGMSFETTVRIIGAILLIVGVLVLAIGTYLIVRGLHRQKHWIRTNAVIAGYNSYGDEVTTTYAVLNYRDSAGVEHECELKVDWITYPPKGSLTSVCYDPHKPGRAEFPREYAWWFEHCFYLFLFGVGPTFAGIASLLISRGLPQR
jgi:hypothetical protein